MSPKEKSVFDFIADYFLKFGYSPTQGEVARGCGMSRTLAMYYINRLVEKGVVDKRGPEYRNLVIL